MSDTIFPSCPPTLDLTNRAHLNQVLEITAKLLAQCASVKAVERLENQLIADKDATPLMVHLAVKLAKSKNTGTP